MQTKKVRKFNLKSKKRFSIILLMFSSLIFITNSIFDDSTKPANSDTSETVLLEQEEFPGFIPFESSPITTKTINVFPKAKPEKFDFSSEIIKNNTTIHEFIRETNIVFPSSQNYSNLKGISTFRGNNYRDTASFGLIPRKPNKLEKIWSINIGKIGAWSGVGWSGQPAIVDWADSVQSKMNIVESKKSNSSLKEVIYATLDGKIYFLDLENGENTRSPINVGHPLKGSISIDPRGYPLLYCGQGLVNKKSSDNSIGFRVFNLFNQKEIFFLDGIDKDSYRRWGAFDSSSLIEPKSDSLIVCGENGIFYSGKLNTNINLNDGTISINPELIKYRYKNPAFPSVGIENSIAAYKNLGYFADNGGFLQCIDLNTLKPVWLMNITDDTDSTIAIEEESDSLVSLYTACEVDIQGKNGRSYIRKINALSGELLWENSYKCLYDSSTNGGTLSSPIVGKNSISNLVIYNVAKIHNGLRGKMIAFDKSTGDVVWSTYIPSFGWSSPVDVYTDSGNAFLVFCDSNGIMYLMDASDGKIIDKINIEGNVEGSPAVYNDIVIVGTRCEKIWGIKIK